MILNSIRWRIQLWYGLILVLVLAGFGVTSWQLQRRDQFRRVDEDLARRLGALDDSLRNPLGGRAALRNGEGRPFLPGPGRDGSRRFRPDGPPPEGPLDGPDFPDGPPRFPGGPAGMLPDVSQPPREFRLLPRQALLFDQADTNGFYYVVWARTGVELGRSSNAPPDVLKPDAGRGSNVEPHLRGSRREAARVTPAGEIVFVGRSVAEELTGLKAMAGWLALAGGVILLLGLAGGWWLSSRAMRPIGTISTTAAKIATGDLSQRIAVEDTESELGQLAALLNSTFARLEAAFHQQKQFTADAAHELRTPISVMLTQTQTALHRERSAPEYRQTLEACQRAAQRMRKLIEGLLELARIDAGQENLHSTDFDLAALAAECVQEATPLARQRGISVTTELAAATCHADRERVGQVLTNLLANAVHYNKESGSITVRSEGHNGCVVLSVTDTGIGIPEEELPNLFRRFYRVDKSRTAGRSGLGLSISKALVEAQGGSIEVKSKPGEGSTFSVTLPAGVSIKQD